jgi:replicative DNA helicase
MNLGKLPPQALDLEEAVLGALLLEKDAFTRVYDILTSESFYNTANQLIYSAIASLFAKSSAIDILTVTAELRRTGHLEMVGGAYYVTNLTSRLASSANITDHAQIVVQKYIQRETIRICTETISNAYDDTNDIYDLVETHQAQIFDTVKNAYGKTETHISEAVKERLIEYGKKQVDGLTGIGTGFKNLDTFTSGWQKQDLIIIAARPAMGKTALAIETAKYAATMHNYPVGIFSLEMSTAQLTDRLISSETGVFQNKIKKRDLSEYDWQQIHNGITKLVDSNIYIDDTAGISINSMRSKAIRMKERYGIELLVVDYLQLMSGAGEKNGNREQEIGKISRGLKMIAKDLDIPVIALSQLSRAVESRPGLNGKRPMLSDLRESGSIEQDADQVIFLYRPEYYGITEYEDGQTTAKRCELIFGKNRNGVCDIVDMEFNGALMKFSDFETEQPTFTLPQAVNYSEPSYEHQVITLRPSASFDDDPPF